MTEPELPQSVLDTIADVLIREAEAQAEQEEATG